MCVVKIDSRLSEGDYNTFTTLLRKKLLSNNILIYKRNNNHTDARISCLLLSLLLIHDKMRASFYLNKLHNLLIIEGKFSGDRKGFLLYKLYVGLQCSKTDR